MARKQLTDRRGLPVSTRSAEAVERYDEAVELTLSANVGREEKLALAIEADDGFALAHAALALTLQFQGEMAGAKESAERAQTLVRGANRRERQHVEVIARLVGGDTAGATPLVREHLSEFPRDALLLSQNAILSNTSGRVDRHAVSLAFLSSLAPAYGDDWYFLAVLGFIHHELDHFDESQRLSERAMALYPRNGLATHSLAHIFYETNDHTTGRGFLDGWMGDYPHGAPLHCHLSWHQALFALSAGHYGRVMELYARDLDPTLVRARTLLFDTASILWRLDMYGCAEGPLPWAEVCDVAKRMTAKPGVAFADAHAALAYAGAGDSAAMAGLLADLTELGAQGREVVREVVLPLVLGIDAFGRGAYNEAIGHIEPVMPDLVRIGGSNAQREVFEDTLLQAYLRAGRFNDAQSLLKRRVGRRHSARDFFWLGRAQAGQSNTNGATESFDIAGRSWQNADPDALEQHALRTARQASALA